MKNNENKNEKKNENKKLKMKYEHESWQKFVGKKIKKHLRQFNFGSLL